MKSRITHRAPSDLVAGYLPLVKASAARFRQHVASQTELDGLVADGLLGLHDAANQCSPNQCSPNQPVRFATYAKQRIRGAILDRLKNQYSVPRSFRSRRPQNAIPMPTRSSGTTLNEGHLESEFGLTLHHLENALAAMSHEGLNRRKELRGGTDQSVKVTVLANPQVFLPDAIPAGSAIEVQCEDCTFRARVVYCLFHPRPSGTGYWWIGIQIAHRPWELVEPLARPKTTTAK